MMFVLNRATALCFRMFEVADTIDLEKCRTLLKTGGKVSLTREGSEYVQLSNPPLSLDLGPASLMVNGAALTVELAARVFDYGCISICLKVPIPKGMSLEALIPYADALYDSPDVDTAAASALEKLGAQLKSALQNPHRWRKNEGYTILVAQEIEGNPTPDALLKDETLARLLLGEVKEPRLSPAETREVLDHHFSYTERDLAIIEWNASFLYEPSGNTDIVDLLEIANAQLLELRYYDDVLDGELTRMYDLIEQQRGGSLLKSPYKKLLRDLMQTLIELSEFIERIENALKIVGDVYLARVYESAVVQLRIKQWTEQVTRKHRLLQQTYGLLKGEVDTDRALTLEIMVVVLILLEMLIAVGQLVGGIRG